MKRPIETYFQKIKDSKKEEILNRYNKSDFEKLSKK